MGITENFDPSKVSLDLQCLISFTNYDNISRASTTADVVLSDNKDRKGGAILVRQTDNFEFWVMTHGIQDAHDGRFINNFQVAIQIKDSGLFVHALSDSVYELGRQPKQARVSLIDYQNDTFNETGELLFECKSK